MKKTNKKNQKSRPSRLASTMSEPPPEIIKRTAHIAITIEEGGFHPLGSVMGIDASLAITNKVRGVVIVPDPDVSVVDGNSIRIKQRNDDEESIALEFFLEQPEYLLIGIAFRRRGGQLKGGDEGVGGQEEFPSVNLVPSANTAGIGPSFRSMRVEDRRQRAHYNQSFQYAILVQNVHTGELGAIDPDIENESVDP